MAETVLVVATMDTKGEEASWVAARIRDQGLAALTVDVSASQQIPLIAADISRSQVLACGGSNEASLSLDRGEAVAEVSRCLGELLVQKFARDEFAGLIGLGGSGGTSLISSAARRLPIGLPKAIVSTIASGNTSAYVDCSDLVLFPSVLDIAGLNAVSMDILQNAAHAICGMVKHRAKIVSHKPLLGLTMFGVTTPCVMAVKAQLEKDGWECLVFHAVGTGGRSMEKLVESGRIVGVLDITTTEVADFLCGGVFPATADRFDVFAHYKVPLIVSFGALDMVNFGPRHSVPTHYEHRQFHVHNAQVTLMRTTPEENAAAGRWIADKLNRVAGPLRVLIPEAGVSALDAIDRPFWNPAADASLFTAFEKHFMPTQQHTLTRLPLNINDEKFSAEIVRQFRELQ